jgi:hypothetical protein
MYATGVNPESPESNVLKDSKSLWIFGASDSKVQFVEPRLESLSHSVGHIESMKNTLSSLSGVPVSSLYGGSGSAPSGEALDKMFEGTITMIQGYAAIVKPILTNLVSYLVTNHCNIPCSPSDLNIAWGDVVTESAGVTKTKLETFSYAKDQGYISEQEAINMARSQLKMDNN